MAAKLNANNNRYHSVIIRNILISLMVNIFDEIRALKDPTVQRKSHLVKNLHKSLTEITGISFVENISLVHCAHLWNIFQHSQRNFVSPRRHVMSSIYYWMISVVLCNFLQSLHLNQRSYKLNAPVLMTEPPQMPVWEYIFSGTDLAFCHQ